MANPYMKRAQKLAGNAESAVRQATTPLRNFGFPFRAPTVPRGVEVPPEASGLGAHYDTGWARRPLASSIRGVITEGPMRLAARILTNPEVTGVDRLASLQRLETPATRDLCSDAPQPLGHRPDDPVNSARVAT